MYVNYRVGNSCDTLVTTSSNMGSSISRSTKCPNRNHRRVGNDDNIEVKHIEKTKHLKTRNVSSSTCTPRRTTMTGRSTSYKNLVTRNRALSIDYTRCTYDFENIILQGGGNKAMAYCGAVRVLEEIGVWNSIRRVAGASAGAMTATLLAVGYNSYDIENFLGEDIQSVFLDANCGYCSLLPNLVRHYGWNPGKRILEWFGSKIEQQTGNKDTTFQEVYNKFGIELCIVVTNLNQMSTEYCHCKTTPDMPVRVAARMSMAIPGMFKATKHMSHGYEDVYVDGGILCNYPIHVFDGWWLSLASQDTFLKKLQPLSALPKLYEKDERFGSHNKKTLGLMVYSEDEQDIMRTEIEERLGADTLAYPDTPLASQRHAKKVQQNAAAHQHDKIFDAAEAFTKTLNSHNINEDDHINISEMESAINDITAFSQDQRDTLFGKGNNAQNIFDTIDTNHNGKITYHELQHFLEEHGVTFQAHFLGYQRCDIDNLAEFLGALSNTLLTNVNRIYVEERDVGRTVGINTGYIRTTDFKLQPQDRDYIVNQGRQSMVNFLKYWAADNVATCKEYEKSSANL